MAAGSWCTGIERWRRVLCGRARRATSPRASRAARGHGTADHIRGEGTFSATRKIKSNSIQIKNL